MGLGNVREAKNRKKSRRMGIILTETNNIVLTSIDIKPIAIPLSRPFSNHLRTINKVDGIVCQIHTNLGISGQGLVYGLGEINHKIMIDCIEGIVPRIINTSVVTPKQINSIMLDANLPNSFELHNVIAAIDIAIWDIYLKEKNISLHQMLGSSRSNIPVYDTAGWLSLSLQELVDTCQRNLAQGINALKVRLGHENDSERIAHLRKTMGNEFTLMVDANQRFSTDEAIKVIRDLSVYQLAWIEEPVGSSLNDLKQVSEQSLIPIAVGENIKSKNLFQEICEKKLANFLQPDIRSCMGLTEFIDICELIKQYDVSLCSHLMHELSAIVVAGCSNGTWVEYLDIIPPDCFTHDFLIKEGKISIPVVAGTGVQLTDEAIKRFSV